MRSTNASLHIMQYCGNMKVDSGAVRNKTSYDNQDNRINDVFCCDVR